MGEPATCQNCYQFKLRSKDGSGMCWHLHLPRHAEQEICEAFEAKVIKVNWPSSSPT